MMDGLRIGAIGASRRMVSLAEILRMLHMFLSSQGSFGLFGSHEFLVAKPKVFGVLEKRGFGPMCFRDVKFSWKRMGNLPKTRPQDDSTQVQGLTSFGSAFAQSASMMIIQLGIFQIQNPLGPPAF